MGYMPLVHKNWNRFQILLASVLICATYNAVQLQHGSQLNLAALQHSQPHCTTIMLDMPMSDQCFLAKPRLTLAYRLLPVATGCCFS
jgi:hypothetical protein